MNINQCAFESSLHGGSNALGIISVGQVFEKLSKVELHTLLLHPEQFAAYLVFENLRNRKQSNIDKASCEYTT